MTEHPCPVCQAPAPTTHICWACAKRITHLLALLDEDLQQLYQQLDPTGHQPGSGTSKSADPPLPINLRAATTLDDVRTVLVGWTRESCEHENRWPHDDSETAMLLRLKQTRWQTHPAADELLDELEYTHTQVLAAIDNPPERRYLGPCGADLGDENECLGDVIARGNREPTCADCGAQHDLGARMAWIVDVTADHLVTAADAAGALSAWGQRITADLIRLWAHRGRILAHGTNRRGRPVYRFGDIRDLAADTLQRRALDSDLTRRHDASCKT